MPSPLNDATGSEREPQFQALVAELCKRAEIDPNEARSTSLHTLLQVIARQSPRALSTVALPKESVLLLKVGMLQPGGAVHRVCQELTETKGIPLEDFAKSAVVALLKQCGPKPGRTTKPTKRQLRQADKTATINRRRGYGEL